MTRLCEHSLCEIGNSAETPPKHAIGTFARLVASAGNPRGSYPIAPARVSRFGQTTEGADELC